jgi:hypothetical protein
LGAAGGWELNEERVERLRRWMLWLMVFGLVGTEVELVLLGHYEEFIQWAPLVLIGLTLGVLAWHAWQPGETSLRVLKGVMWLFLAAGLVGVVLHFQGAAEFQLEINPAMPKGELISKAMHAQAPPVLAPGAMMQLGFLGLLYAFTHRSKGRELS